MQNVKAANTCDIKRKGSAVGEGPPLNFINHFSNI